MFSFLFSCSGDHRDLPSFPTRRSSDLISPALGSSKPATMRSVVVLPQPDGPTSTTNSPSSIARLTLFTAATAPNDLLRSEEHTSELQSHVNLVCRLLLEKKKKKLTTSE